jgi:hypothetical protein
LPNLVPLHVFFELFLLFVMHHFCFHFLLSLGLAPCQLLEVGYLARDDPGESATSAASRNRITVAVPSRTCFTVR